MNRLQHFSVAALVALAATSAAQAQVREIQHVSVSSIGVDFHNSKVVAEFDERLRRAAVLACDSGQPKILGVISADQKCATEAWQSAVHSVNQPLLSQLHHQGVYLAANQ